MEAPFKIIQSKHKNHKKVTKFAKSIYIKYKKMLKL